MSDAPPPPVPEGTVCTAPQALTPERIEAVLADFRVWLEQLAVSSANQLEPLASNQPGVQPVDLHTLLGQFIALRHEVNLQTRATRTQQEQTSEALRQLGQALEALDQDKEALRAQLEASQEELLRPNLKSLVDIYDALVLGRKEILRVRDTLLPELEQTEQEAARLAAQPFAPVCPEPPRRTFWAKLFGSEPVVAPAPVLPQLEEWRAFLGKMSFTTSRARQVLSSLLTGYTMSLQRIERALQQNELETIAVVGEPFDPERMEVVEVVIEPGRENTEVIEEVRRGYLWRERVFRFAQVRVAKPNPENI